MPPPPRPQFGRWILIGGNQDRTSFPDYHSSETQHHRWNWVRYSQAVLAQLRLIGSRHVGQFVLGAIARRVMIVPVQGEIPDNAEARSTTNVDGPFSLIGNRSFQSAENAVYACQVGTVIPQNGLACTGGGTEALVDYTPGFFVRSNPLYNQRQGQQPDEVLLHELVHAMRITRGVWDPTPTAGSLARYTSNDEFHAILLTNIYRSAHTRGRLRGDHSLDFHTLQNPSAFYSRPDNRRMVAALCQQLPDMTRNLAVIDCGFNPIRQHYQATGQLD